MCYNFTMQSSKILAESNENKLNLQSTTKKTITLTDYHSLFADLAKEIEEIKNEPLAPSTEIDSSLSGDKDNLEILKGPSKKSSEYNMAIENSESKCLRNKKVETTHDSFDLSFDKVPLATPVRPIIRSVIKTTGPRLIHLRNSVNRTQLACPNSLVKTSNKVLFTTPGLDKKYQKFVRTDTSSSWKDNLETIKIKDTVYIVLNELGKGGSSTVHNCIDVKSKVNRAIKSVSLANPVSAQGYINEVHALIRLQKCNRIVKMYDYEHLESEKKLLIVLEIGGKDMAGVLKNLANDEAPIPLYMLLFHWMEMLYAVQQMHSHGIIHSDLKPANFLYVDGTLKLIDFGIASCLQNDMTSVFKSVSEGSFNYISPEALNDEYSANPTSPSYGKPKYKISYKSDVWSLGCILYQLVYRKTPFQHIPKLRPKLLAIINPDTVIDYPAIVGFPSKIIDTIKKCLNFQSKSRPSVEELILEYENFSFV